MSLHRPNQVSACNFPYALLLLVIVNLCFTFNGIVTVEAIPDASIPISASPSTEEKCNSTLVEFNMMVDGIEQALDFLEDNLEGIIVDTAMGTRTIEGNFIIKKGHITFVIKSN